MTIGGSGLVATLEATHPLQAVRWIKTALRGVVGSLDPPQTAAAAVFFTDGHWTALDALRENRPFAFSIHCGTTHIEWSVRPALFLPLQPACVARL
ncbi:hypothetical protein [Streptomyces sp. H27-D2]|uniref:hypothetical protein n=1 Tax=Streptomyces sp. H27-D2 TaxID=3046304 RepID=UPI002DB9F667|nr:hypothetical protein [Streptomyces sp. H27-D2]MEC4017129.1 hypothetical protein [Streptomyces sp. H27-D2]